MLKKLLKYQLIGLAAIWLYVALSAWTMEPAAHEVVARHDELPATVDTPAATTAEAEAEVVGSVAPLPKKEVSKVSSRSGKRAKLRFPVAGHDADAIISVFGDKRGSKRLHKGVDIKAPRHTPVVAVVDGFVEKVREGGSGGKQVYLRAGDGRLYYYAHLEDWTVEEYESVREGTQLGTVGDSGNARNTTPHLHFEVLVGKDREALDPYPLLTTIVP